MMEEDRDLEELKKAIDAGDKERAKRIAVTLFKRPKVKGNPNPEGTFQLVAVIAGVAIAVISIIGMWMEHSEKKRRRELAYV